MGKQQKHTHWHVDVEPEIGLKINVVPVGAGPSRAVRVVSLMTATASRLQSYRRTGTTCKANQRGRTPTSLKQRTSSVRK
jgi:hypothetical protein